jgi:hypothetical protein
MMPRRPVNPREKNRVANHPREVYALEIRHFVDQRRQRIGNFIDAHAEQLTHQGTIVSSFRCRGGQRVGPYYRLTFREGRNQRSLYLGNDMDLIAEARTVLQELQRPYRERRAVQRCKSAIRKALTHCRTELRRELARRGLRLQGHEVRGWHTPGP